MTLLTFDFITLTKIYRTFNSKGDLYNVKTTYVFKYRADANAEISIWPFTIWFLTPWLHSYEDPGYRWQLYPFAYRTQVIYYTFWCSKIIFSMFSIYSVSLKIVCHFSALSCGNLIFMHWFVVKVVYIALSLRARYFALWLRSINLAIRRVTFLSFHQFEIL